MGRGSNVGASCLLFSFSFREWGVFIYFTNKDLRQEELPDPVSSSASSVKAIWAKGGAEAGKEANEMANASSIVGNKRNEALGIQSGQNLTVNASFEGAEDHRLDVRSVNGQTATMRMCSRRPKLPRLPWLSCETACRVI